MELVHQAILAGIFNDLGSGSNVDLTVITKDGVEPYRNMDMANPRPYRYQRGYYLRGRTVPLGEKRLPRKPEFLEPEDTTATTSKTDKMEE